MEADMPVRHHHLVLDFSLLRYRQCVVGFDAEVTNRAFELCVA